MATGERNPYAANTKSRISLPRDDKIGPILRFRSEKLRLGLYSRKEHLLRALPQPHPRLIAVRELDAGGFKGASHCVSIIRVATRWAVARLHATQGRYRYPGRGRQLRLAEANERSSCSNLPACKTIVFAHFNQNLLTWAE